MRIRLSTTEEVQEFLRARGRGVHDGLGLVRGDLEANDQLVEELAFGVILIAVGEGEQDGVLEEDAAVIGR
jgi:hypothetical protein